jgi:hypothetical protein
VHRRVENVHKNEDAARTNENIVTLWYCRLFHCKLHSEELTYGHGQSYVTMKLLLKKLFVIRYRICSAAFIIDELE